MHRLHRLFCLTFEGGFCAYRIIGSHIFPSKGDIWTIFFPRFSILEAPGFWRINGRQKPSGSLRLRAPFWVEIRGQTSCGMFLRSKAMHRSIDLVLDVQHLGLFAAASFRWTSEAERGEISTGFSWYGRTRISKKGVSEVCVCFFCCFFKARFSRCWFHEKIRRSSYFFSIAGGGRFLLSTVCMYIYIYRVPGVSKDACFGKHSANPCAS